MKRSKRSSRALCGFYPLLCGWQALRRSSLSHALAWAGVAWAMWGALVSLIMWATHGFFDTPYFKNDMSAEFWIVAAIDVSAVVSVALAASHLRRDAADRERLAPGS